MVTVEHALRGILDAHLAPASSSSTTSTTTTTSADGSAGSDGSTATAAGNTVTATPGCLDGTQCVDTAGFASAVEAATTSDVVVFALGLCGRPKIQQTQNQIQKGQVQNQLVAAGADGTEGEGHDRMNISLPDGQVGNVSVISQGSAKNCGAVLSLYPPRPPPASR